MIYRKDFLFDEFSCIANECPLSCCLGWQIMIDEESLKEYEELAKDWPLLAEGIDWEEGCFLQKSRRCAMLREDDLCQIQARLGHEALSFTCRTYPRHTEEFEGEREFSLSLSCPRAAEMILSQKSAFSYIEWEDDTMDEEFEDEEFDFFLYSKLLDARELIFHLGCQREIPLWQRLCLLEDLAKRLQLCWDEGDVEAFDQTIEEFSVKQENKSRQETKSKQEVESKPENKEKQEIEMLKEAYLQLLDLENLQENWKSLLLACQAKYFGKEDYACLIRLQELDAEEEVAGEQILMSLIYTYFLGAVYDNRIYSKLAFCIYSVRWILLLADCIDSETSKAETKVQVQEGTTRLIETTYRYCREIEHSDINLGELENYFDSLV